MVKSPFHAHRQVLIHKYTHTPKRLDIIFYGHTVPRFYINIYKTLSLPLTQPSFICVCSPSWHEKNGLYPS